MDFYSKHISMSAYGKNLLDSTGQIWIKTVVLFSALTTFITAIGITVSFTIILHVSTIIAFLIFFFIGLLHWNLLRNILTYDLTSINRNKFTFNSISGLLRYVFFSRISIGWFTRLSLIGFMILFTSPMISFTVISQFQSKIYEINQENNSQEKVQRNNISNNQNTPFQNYLYFLERDTLVKSIDRFIMVVFVLPYLALFLLKILQPRSIYIYYNPLLQESYLRFIESNSNVNFSPIEFEEHFFTKNNTEQISSEITKPIHNLENNFNKIDIALNMLSESIQEIEKVKAESRDMEGQARKIRSELYSLKNERELLYDDIKNIQSINEQKLKTIRKALLLEESSQKRQQVFNAFITGILSSLVATALIYYYEVFKYISSFFQ